MKETSHILLFILAAAVIGGAGFFLGRHLKLLPAVSWSIGQPYRNVRRALFPHDHWGLGKDSGIMGRGGTTGEITKVDGEKITLKRADGSSQEITLPSETVVRTTTKGTTQDLRVGQTVLVRSGSFWGTTAVIVQPQ